MVLPDSDGISRVPPYSGSTQERTNFRLQGFYLLWRISKSLHLTRSFVTPYRVPQPQEASLLVWALPVSLAATRNRFLSLLPRVSASRLRRYVFTSRYYAIKRSGFPIRKSPDQSSLTAPEAYRLVPPSLLCQGIRRAP